MFYPFTIQTILSFCEGNYLFVTINKEWKDIYILLFKKTKTRIGCCLPQQIEYAIQAGYRLSRKTIMSAAKLGNLNILKYFINEDKYILYENVCSNAALSGQFEVLKWARENSCPWNTQTCTNAARSGNIELFKWARKNNCPWDVCTCAYAAK